MSATGEPVRVIVASSDSLLLQLVQVACTDDDIEVAGVARTCEDLLERCGETQPDVVVVDAELADGPVEPCMPQVLEHGARVVVIDDDNSPERVSSLLAAGASGWLHVDSDVDDINRAVRTLAEGGVVLDSSLVDEVVARWRRSRGRRRRG